MPRRALALVIACGVDWWIRTGRSGQLLTEIVTYGNHGGVGWGGDGPCIDEIDECFRAHDRAYDRIKGA